VAAYFKPLRFLGGERYEEFVYVSDENRRIVVTERREPAKTPQQGRLLYLAVVISGDINGALLQGRLAPSVREWFAQSETILTEPRSESVQPWTADRAHDAFRAILSASGGNPDTTASHQLPGDSSSSATDDIQPDWPYMEPPPKGRSARGMRKPGDEHL